MEYILFSETQGVILRYPHSHFASSLLSSAAAGLISQLALLRAITEGSCYVWSQSAVRMRLSCSSTIWFSIKREDEDEDEELNRIERTR